MDRRALFYALLLSVPPGIGVVGFATIATGGGLVAPVGLAMGLAVAAAIFVVVLVGASGEAPESFDGPVE